MDNNLYALPWAIKEMRLHEGGEGFEVQDKDGEIVLDNQTFYPEPPSYDNAALIVRAVNSHDALTDALKQTLEEAVAWYLAATAAQPGDEDGFDWVKKARAALASAEEKP